jgi:hypothetical protein
MFFKNLFFSIFSRDDDCCSDLSTDSENISSEDEDNDIITFSINEKVENPFEKGFEFFTIVNSNTKVEKYIPMFQKIWDIHPSLAIKILMNLRDKNIITISHILMIWLKINYPKIYNKLLFTIVELGNWKDIMYICEICIYYGDLDISVEIQMFANQLLDDFENYQKKTVSLAAKWAPSEKTHFNKKPLYFANKIRKVCDKNPSQYRKMISTLRARINVLESGSESESESESTRQEESTMDFFRDVVDNYTVPLLRTTDFINTQQSLDIEKLNDIVTKKLQ